MTYETAGRFTLVRKLPAGGMGRVFEAGDPASGRRVALKLIDLGTDSDSVQIVKAERQGAELQRQLCVMDKRVTEIYESGEMPNYFYIVMEYVDGNDVSELATGHGLSPEFAARVAQDVLEVLDRAHNLVTNIEGRLSRGIVHGDLKPRNIRVTPDGRVKVLDFGIAKALSVTRSFTQNMFASAQYSSPERMMTGEVDVSSDLWGVAVVLYELLSGHPYFEAESGPKLEHIVRNYRQPRPLPSDWPEVLRQILGRALDPNPQARYRTAGEFVGALEAFRSGSALPVYARAATEEASEATRRVSQPSDATVRTYGSVPSRPAPPTAESEATRRVAPQQSAYGAGQRYQPVPMPAAAVRRRTPLSQLLRILSIAVLGVFLVAVYFVTSEYMVWRKADQLARDLSSEKQQNLDLAWRQYTELASHSRLPVTLWSAEDALRNRFTSDADHTLARYQESDLPPVSEADWMRSRNELAHALELSPNDKTVHGKLRLVDGHLARIRGSARRDSRLLDESRQDFEDAAGYMKKSPDPWLGLARLYIYSMHDVEHGEAAFKEAERRGHDIGKRETAQLADGYRYQAERTMQAGDRASNQAEAGRYYDLAGESLDHARELYESILPWAGAATNLKRVEELQLRMASHRSSVREP